VEFFFGIKIKYNKKPAEGKEPTPSDKTGETSASFRKILTRTTTTKTLFFYF
jgi:hypothetical protein